MTLDYPKYVPIPQKYEGEHYNTFSEMKKARPDVIKPIEDPELNQYYVTWDL